jgi:putative PIN family toxin of toxin-antitoxin system
MWRGVRGTCEIFASPEILAEIEEKLRLKFRFSPRHSRLLTAFVRRQINPVHTTGSPPAVCRDPDDDFILAAAVQSACAYVVTGDKDLLALGRLAGVAIVTPGEFAKLLSVI